MNLRQKSFSKGFSSIEILVAIGVFSITLLASISFFSQINRSIQMQNQSEIQRRIFQGVIYLIGMPSTLRGSMEHDTSNGILWKSIRNNLGSLPVSPVPLTLFLPVVTGNSTSVFTSGKISGPPSSPLLYSLDGGSCDPSTGANCDPKIYSISVSTEFLPICPPQYDYWNGAWAGPVFPNGLVLSNSCNRAQYIKVFYNFKPTPGAPPELVFAPITGSVMVNAILANACI